MRDTVLAAALLMILAAPSNAQGARINYKQDNLQCTFTKECGEGHSMVIIGRQIDKSACLDINHILTWNPGTKGLTFRGKPMNLQYVEERRNRVSVGFKLGAEHVNFSAGDQVPTLRFRAAPQGSSPILRMMSGVCRIAE
jgi:hypothetical protein